jgi:hypothetical protein
MPGAGVGDCVLYQFGRRSWLLLFLLGTFLGLVGIVSGLLAACRAGMRSVVVHAVYTRACLHVVMGMLY